MKKLHTMLIITSLLFGNIGLSSQVTIGSDTPPIPGALLDLKEKETNNDSPNSTKGLLLPRVALTSPWNLFPMFGEIDEVTGVMVATQEYEDDKAGERNIDNSHIGLLVFNTEKQEIVNDRLCPGLHVWSGTEWVPLDPYPVFEVPAENLSGYAGTLTDIRGGGIEVNNYHTARFRSVVASSGNPYSCDPNEVVQFEIIDAGTWMTENLNTKYAPINDAPIFVTGTKGMGYREANYFYPNGIKIGNEGSPTPPATWTKEQGLIYNWAAATITSSGVYGQGGIGQAGDGWATGGKGNIDYPNDQNAEEDGMTHSVRQGICPAGWHLPSDAEWAELEVVVAADPNDYTIAGANISGSEPGFIFLKEALDLKGLDTKGRSLPANEGGFATILAGYAVGYESKSYNENAYFWSSSSSTKSDGTTSAFSWGRFLHSRDHLILKDAQERNDLYSVRCKKD